MAAPLVTLAMPCCDQDRYVAEALDSLFAQTYTPLQIVVCDDASTDATHAVVAGRAAAYDGPHEIEVSRNETRRGIETYNRLMEMARGEFVVIAHSDDVSLPHRVERLVEAWRRSGASLVSSDAVIIDANGKRLRPFADPGETYDVSLESISGNGWNKALLGATLAWERAVFDRFGPLNRASSAVSSDWILPFRAALLRGVHYVAEPLLLYREHPQSRSHRFLHDAAAPAIGHERHLGNNTAQFTYMLETLSSFRAQPGNDDARLADIERRLAWSILHCAIAWSKHRNAMLAAGWRISWTKPA